MIMIPATVLFVLVFLLMVLVLVNLTIHKKIILDGIITATVQ